MSSDITMDEHLMRPLRCELNILSRPDGSAMLTQGKTVVMAATYGPVEVKPQKVLIDKAYVEVVYHPKAGLPCVADRMQEFVIRNTCETALLTTIYPRTSILIVLQEMQDSGGLLSCTINAACLALINSGISMKFLIAAVSCMLDKENNIILDPSAKQLKESQASMTFVFDSMEKNVIASRTTGNFTQTQYHESLLKCRQASDKVFTFYRDMVRKYVDRL